METTHSPVETTHSTVELHTVLRKLHTVLRTLHTAPWKLHTALRKLHTAPWKLLRGLWKLHTAICKTSRRRFVFTASFLSIFIQCVSCCEKSPKNIHIFYHCRPSPERQRARRQTLHPCCLLWPSRSPTSSSNSGVVPRNFAFAVKQPSAQANEWSDKFEHER